MRALGAPVDTLRSQMGLPAGGGWTGVTPATLVPLQARLGVPQTGRFDPETAARVGYYDTGKLVPGGQTGTFSRDAATASAQIPWWMWTLAGVSLLGVGGFIWYRGRQKKV
jgi:hypothetical protein